MRYYIDTEFNGFGGSLLSMALVSEMGQELYLARPLSDIESMRLDPFVAKKVLPVLEADQAAPESLALCEWPFRLERFLKDDASPVFIADWHDDIRFLMEVMTVQPGKMIRLPDFTCRIVHIESWPNQLQGAVRHNALWDARALRSALIPDEHIRTA